MIANKKTPWAGFGIELKNTNNIEEAIKEARLDWDVGLKHLFTEDAEIIPEREIYCKANGKLFGVVGPDFTPVQNIDAFKWFQPFLDSNECSLDVAGSSRDGRRIWILARINRPDMEILPGDSIGKRILLSNAHIQGVSCRVGYCPIRFLCSNALARAGKVSDVIRVNHSMRILSNLEKIRDIMNLANTQFEATAEQYRALTRRGINQADIMKYVKICLNAGDDVSTRMKNTINEILRLNEVGPGTEVKGVVGTYWGAYNAYNSYLNFIRGRNTDNRLESLWFGQGFNDNKRALEVALELAA